jgi:diguanylate cyclase (GGDEF)-like protein
MSDLAASSVGPVVAAPPRDDRQMLRVVSRLASLAMTPCSPDDVLRELCDVAGLVVVVDGIGVMQVVPDGSTGYARYVAAQPPVIDVEQAQEDLQRGPCRDAIDSGDVVVVEDVCTVGDRYGELSARMLDAGMCAVIAVPLLGRGRVWGTLDLYRRRPGAWADADLEAALLLAHVAVAYLVMAGDRDEARAARREVEHRSLHDSLTGIPNRVLLYDRIEHALASADRHGTVVGIAFVDLDRFKRINDTLGHAVGDEVLVEVARRLASVIRSVDTPARLAGDEFVVLLADLPAEADARGRIVAGVCERLRRVLAQPIAVAGTSVVVTASVGVVVPAGPATADELVHQADVAMYAAKVRRDAVVVHDRRAQHGGGYDAGSRLA